jgi:chain length determinant protein tyrosine kinase EpsG
MGEPDNVLPIESTARLLSRQDRSLGGLLAAEGKLGAEDIEQVLRLQKARRCRFGEAAVRLGLVSEADVHRALARQHDAPAPLAPSVRAGAELVVAREPFHPCAEELRALRTQLLVRWDNARVQPRRLAIVSPGAGEGRSYLAANLAVAFAQLGERTLLVDADLRAPRQHRIFGVPELPGLSAWLSARAAREALRPLPDFGPLTLLPAGALPPNPLELLSRPAFGALLRELQAEFDVVVFDTPPARPYADAQTVAFRAGHALALARRDHTRLTDAAQVVRELSNCGTRVVGTVANAF